MKLNPEFKAKWVAALRSGNYKQAYYSLVDWGPTPEHGPRAFCCLGVGCVVSGVDPKELRNLDVPTRSHVDGWWDGDGGPYALPYDPCVHVDDCWKLSDDSNTLLYNPLVHMGCVDYHLSEVNDMLRLNFAQIADIIEQQL
jgi:hypothetical protein